MSSVLRSPSQIEVRAKFFLCWGTAPEVTGKTNGELFGNGGASAVRVTNGVYPSFSPVMTTNEITAVIVAEGATADTGDNALSFNGTNNFGYPMFRDLGRGITVVDESGSHIATYRECQWINGSGSEGVDSTAGATYRANYYVRVWAADGTGVIVTRIG